MIFNSVQIMLNNKFGQIEAQINLGHKITYYKNVQNFGHKHFLLVSF